MESKAGMNLVIDAVFIPGTLVPLEGVLGCPLLVVVWGLAIVGIRLKLFFTGRFDRLSVAIYVAMGWCGLVAADIGRDADRVSHARGAPPTR